jgi:primosomal protein DnaI
MTIKEMMKVIQSDEETKHLNVSGLDVLKVYQYLEFKHDPNKDPNFTAKLITQPYIECIFEPTSVKKRSLKVEKLKKYMDIFESEVHIQDASLKTFHLKTDARKEAYKMATSFLELYQSKKHPKGLYIYGKYGSGKSYLLSALASELSELGYLVILTYMPDLVRSMKGGLQAFDLEKRINILKQVDILMLDDIGGEFSSAWFRDEILMPLIQYRLSANLPTFFSSNYSLRELTETMSISNASEDNRIKAARLVRRINDMTHVIKLSDTFKNEDSVV